MSEQSNDSKNNEMYGLTESPSITPHSYSYGPTPDVTKLLAETPSEGIAAEIHRLYRDKDPDVVYRWDGTTWNLLAEDKLEPAPIPETTKVGPLPWKHGEGAALVLGAMNLTGDEQVTLVSCKVIEMTFESKAGDYQAVRGFWRVAPDNLWAHVPVHDPGKLVDEAMGNVGLLTKVHHVIASALDAEVYAVASERADRQVAAKDIEAAMKVRRYDAGREVVKTQKTGETL